MKKLLPALLLAVALSAACGNSADVGTPSTLVEQTTIAAVPSEPQPSEDADCPYLSETEVAQYNGQQVGKVRVSADQPHPSCFFYRGNGRELQARVWVYSGTAAVANQLINHAVPQPEKPPAELADGWRGGAQRTSTGAVFAVVKGEHAIVVTTNQNRTIAAKRITEAAMVRLRLS